MQEIDSFYEYAKIFCQYIHETEITYDSIDYLISTVMRLYIAALELPEMEPETNDNIDMSEYIPKSVKISKDLPEAYWEVFNPFEKNEVVGGSLKDDLSDIIRDLERGISEYDAGRIGNARFEWHFGLLHHWGQHAVDFIKALHALRTE